MDSSHRIDQIRTKLAQLKNERFKIDVYLDEEELVQLNSLLRNIVSLNSSKIKTNDLVSNLVIDLLISG